ncbi:MAG: glutamate-1-semialdehyde 2,1-aminomutase [Leptospiraceae bacterium]|nr:glutamate-1-semialdehyde 2,1-aminomutase [Leptospiraceae bacterium]
MNSQELFDRSLKAAPGGVHSPVRGFGSVGGTPVFFNRADGARLFDVSGKDYIDFCQSFGPLILGHRDPDVAAVVRETVETAWTLGACEPWSLELAEFVINAVPWVEKIRFVNSGTEAVMSALRVARAATGRQKILKFDGCYHGHLDSLLVKAGSGLAGESASDSAGIGSDLVNNTLVLPLDDEAAVDELFAREGDQIALLAIEALPANYGLLMQRPEYLQHIVNTARKYGALVLFDEVITGFRVGLQGIAGDLGIAPDLVTYGKILGGGFPVGAYAGRRDLMDQVAPAGPVYQAGTLSANPFGMRAGLATLQKCKTRNVYAVLDERTSSFSSTVADLLNQKSDHQWEALQYASLFWLRSKTDAPVRRVDQIPAGHKERYARFFHALLAAGIYLAPSGYEVGFLSFAHDQAVIDQALDRIASAVASL